jgi:hypothetical protein
MLRKAVRPLVARLAEQRPSTVHRVLNRQAEAEPRQRLVSRGSSASLEAWSAVRPNFRSAMVGWSPNIPKPDAGTSRRSTATRPSTTRAAPRRFGHMRTSSNNKAFRPQTPVMAPNNSSRSAMLSSMSGPRITMRTPLRSYGRLAER